MEMTMGSGASLDVKGFVRDRGGLEGSRCEESSDR